MSSATPSPGEIGAPGADRPVHPLSAEHFGEPLLGQAVLRGDERAVRFEKIFQKTRRSGVISLLGHEKNDVVRLRHFLGHEGADRFGKRIPRGRTDDARPLFLHRFHVAAVAAYEIHLRIQPAVGQKSAQHRAHRARAVHGNSPLFFHIFNFSVRARTAPAISNPSKSTTTSA